MDCAKCSYYISEFLDDRLGNVERRQVEIHLEKCVSCGELKDDLLRMKYFCSIKKQEKPKKDYFEYLQCNIKRRILAQNVVTFKERVVQFCTRPSWAMTAVLFVAFSVSVSLNIISFYKKDDSGRVAENVKPDDKILFETAKRTRQPKYTIYNARNDKNEFILNAIPVRAVSSNNQVKIYQ